MKRRALLFTFIVVLALCAACGVWLHVQKEQYALNRQLIDALEHNDTKTALVLVNAGADPNTRTEPSSPPSLKFLMNQLLHHTPPPVNDTPTALILACGRFWMPTTQTTVECPENLPLLQAMLAHNADVQARASFDKNTVLHEAAEMGRVHTVELLLQHGADVNAQDREGRTPLIRAVRFKDDLAVTCLLLAHGANANVQDVNGDTAMHFVLEWNRSNPILCELLVHGANSSLRNKTGYTPLLLAQKMHRPDLVRLLKQGAK